MIDIALTEILRTTNRLPFGDYERHCMTAFIEKSRQLGRDICIGTEAIGTTAEERVDLFRNGVLILSSPTILRTAFMFTKQDAGRSFFGRQKAAYTSYVGDVDRDSWMVGSVFRNWNFALTSVGNVYRAKGHR